MVTIKVGTEKRHEISPYLYMQFMEPLGVCDAAVDTAWDLWENEWYPGVIEKVRELGPTMVRFGGCFASYYHWREAVGPRKERIPMINHCWGGIYHNQIGTHEVIDFCRKVDAEPLIVVNMESEGLLFWQEPKNDICRKGTAEEAADWVSYCNDPDDPLRRAHGQETPYGVKYWQIGNETSYTVFGQRGFTVQQCHDVTCRFAAQMKARDPGIRLIGWGDTDVDKKENWCRPMSQIDEIELLAFHHHFDSGLPDSPLYSTKYRDDYEANWPHLMHAHQSLDAHIRAMRADAGNKRLAITEGHYMLPGRNRNEVLSSWGAGVSYARCLNTIMRHSDVVEIATMADFFGNVWQVNAMMIPGRYFTDGICYLQPVGAVMSLFRHHQGRFALDASVSGAVDAVASMTDDTVYIHAANTEMRKAQQLKLELGGKTIKEAKMFYIAEDPAAEITPQNMDVFAVKTLQIEGDTVTLPAAAVAAIEITLEG
ncbi:MAG: hypothetical protein IJO88_02425 [Oscillospiraceae bacterium]|nr:hypothetical protein [Oscillospiraceae bacterium]